MKAQGALEYLLLIGGAVVVAAVVTVFVLNASSTGSGSAQTSANYIDSQKMQAQFGWSFPQGVGYSGLVGFFGFDSGVNAMYGGHTGTSVGGASVVLDPTRGNVLSLNGSGQYVTYGDAQVYSPSGFTWAAWINPSLTDTRQIISKWQSPGGDETGLSLRLSGGRVVANSGCSGVTAQSSSTVAADTWQHVAIAGDSTSISVYYNGTKQSTGTSCIDLSQISPPLVLGAKSDALATENYSGLMDNVALFTRRLSDSEIASLAGG